MIGFGSGMVLSKGLVLGVRRRERWRHKKTCFSVYVHYFKGIRQRALQSDGVMILGA